MNKNPPSIFSKIWRWVFRPRLRTPQQVLEFALAHLTELTFEQISEMEKAVRKFEMKRGETSSPYVLALHGCRLIHPVHCMKAPSKIVLRWADALTGSGAKSGIWTLGPSKVLDACVHAWRPIVLDALTRAIPSASLKMLEKARDSLYPEDAEIFGVLQRGIESKN